MRRTRFIVLLCLSAACLAISAVLFRQEIQQYQTVQGILPPGSTLAGIPTGGLTVEEAGTRVAQLYSSTPVYLVVDGSSVRLNPSEAGLLLDLPGMLAVTNEAVQESPFWPSFWAFLNREETSAVQTPLACSVDMPALQAYVEKQLQGRYERPATAALPILGDVRYNTGTPGQQVDFHTALPALAQALCSPDARVVELSSSSTPALPPNPDLLSSQLEALVQGSGFDGIVELYYQDLESGEEINFAYSQGKPVSPGIAFTGASTIKIPVMVAAYQRIDQPLSNEERTRMEEMIDLSDNASTDSVMENALDENIAPLQVTETAKTLGLPNTFLAGFFYPGAPLLQRYDTPANTRTDLSTDPDLYNQTTPADMGRLLAQIEHCAEGIPGGISDRLTGQVTQAECVEMIDLLSRNKKGVLIENGLKEGTRMARKYGWVTDPVDGLMHSASDAAVVFTPSGNFALTLYFFHPNQLNWDEAQRLAARLATALDNYYSLKE